MTRTENEKLLKNNGFEPDRLLTNMTQIQLFELIKFTIESVKN